MYAVAELMRLEGRIHVRYNQKDAAMRAFTQSIALARSQGRTSYLLRAGGDLGVLIAQMVDFVGARDVVTQILEAVRKRSEAAEQEEASRVLAAVEREQSK